MYLIVSPHVHPQTLVTLTQSVLHERMKSLSMPWHCYRKSHESHANHASCLHNACVAQFCGGHTLSKISFVKHAHRQTLFHAWYSAKPKCHHSSAVARDTQKCIPAVSADIHNTSCSIHTVKIECVFVGECI